MKLHVSLEGCSPPTQLRCQSLVFVFRTIQGGKKAFEPSPLPRLHRKLFRILFDTHTEAKQKNRRLTPPVLSDIVSIGYLSAAANNGTIIQRTRTPAINVAINFCVFLLNMNYTPLFHERF